MATDGKVQFIVDVQDKASAILKKINKWVDEFGQDIKKSSWEIKKRAENNKASFTKMAAAGGIAFAWLIAGQKRFIDNAVDLEESINAVNVVFGEWASTILQFWQTAAITAGLSQAAFNQMATQTGALLRDTGLEINDVAGKTNELAQRAADMASVFNTDVSDAMSAINQALRGETEAIRRYAWDVTDATLENFALSKGIEKSVRSMTEQEKRLLRVDLIMAQTAVTAGDFTNTSDSLANQQRILNAQLTNMSATLWNAFIPIVQKALAYITPLIDNLASWIERNPTLARNILIVATAVSWLVAILLTNNMNSNNSYDLTNRYINSGNSCFGSNICNRFYGNKNNDRRFCFICYR